MPRTKKLSSQEVADFTQALANVAAAGWALPEGLRAAAVEMDSTRVKDHLFELAEQLEAGVSLEVALRAGDRRLPNFLNGLVAAGVRTGNLPQVLTELAAEHQRSQFTWSQIKLALAYPIILTVLSAIVCALTIAITRPIIHQMGFFDAFGIQRSTAFASQWVWMGDRGIYILISWCAGMLVLLILVRICRGGEFMSRIVASLPAFGKLFMWDGYAEFCRFLRLLLNLNVPLPEALLLVSQGMRSQEMAGVVRELAERTRLGTTLSQAMESTGRVPHSVSTVARWGEQTGQLPEALRLTYEMLDGWIRLRADLLRRVLPPLIYIGVGAFVIGAGYTVLAPAMQMIRGISL